MSGPRRHPSTASRHSPSSSLPCSRLVPALFGAVALASRCADAAVVKGVLSHERRQAASVTTTGNDGNGDGNSALGPTPSTSVALIILYSITGVITALFLLIIVTGAVRAHRHPERYGPRATARYGQPRQSRAKGIARAVLDGIPIVRVGARGDTTPDADATPKPADVEMQTRDSTLMSDGRSETDAVGSRSVETEQVVGGPATAVATEGEHAEKSHGEGETGHPEHAAEPVVNHEQLTCPVCMDEFEEGQEMRVLPCHHNFHPLCIDPWLLNVSGSCPLCRTDLHPHSEEEAAAPEEPVAPEEAHLPPPYNGGTEHSPERHHHHLGFSRYLNLARNSSGDERMAALRQLRQENHRSPEDGENSGGRRNSVLGLGRLKSVLRSNRHAHTDTTGGAATPDSTNTPSTSR